MIIITPNSLSESDITPAKCEKFLITHLQLYRHRRRIGACETSSFAFFPTSLSRADLKHQERGPWTSCQIRKIAGAHAPGMPGTFSPPLRVSDPDMHHATCVTHVPWCMPGSRTSGFLWSRRWGKFSRHSRRKRNPRFYVFGKRPMPLCLFGTLMFYFLCRWWLLHYYP